MTTKTKTAYVCSDCGSEYRKWQGQCVDCKAWNTLTEVRLGSATRSSPISRTGFAAAVDGQIKTLSEITLDEIPRISTSVGELDLVLGGGLVPGSVILVGGEPGAGKSTLLLQTLCHLAKTESALYITGEESPQQVAMRASRLRLPTDKLEIMAETSVETVCAVAQQKKPKIMVIDSIQVMHMEEVTSAPGSVSQVRESASMLVRYAKQTNTVLILVGHVTKDGSLAGPKVLSLIHI